MDMLKAFQAEQNEEMEKLGNKWEDNFQAAQAKTSEAIAGVLDFNGA
jgi:hypothetical protein